MALKSYLAGSEAGESRETGAFFESIGFRPGGRFAILAGLGEFLGGLFLALGFLGPVGPALMITVMLTAIFTVHLGNGFFAFTNGPELPILYIACALTIAIPGPGGYSLDHALSLDSNFSDVLTLIVLGLSILGALGNLGMRRKAKTEIHSSERDSVAAHQSAQP